MRPHLSYALQLLLTLTIEDLCADWHILPPCTHDMSLRSAWHARRGGSHGVQKRRTESSTLCRARFHDNLLGLSVCLAMPLSILALAFTTVMLLVAVYASKAHGTGLPFDNEGWLGVYFLFNRGDPQDALRLSDH